MFKNLRTQMLVEKKYISRKSESQFRNRYILHTRNSKKESLIVGKTQDHSAERCISPPPPLSFFIPPFLITPPPFF